MNEHIGLELLIMQTHFNKYWLKNDKKLNQLSTCFCDLLHTFCVTVPCANPEGGGGGSGPPPPLKNYKNIGFLSNAGPDPRKNYKATKHSMLGYFNVAFRWRADDDPL